MAEKKALRAAAKEKKKQKSNSLLVWKTTVKIMVIVLACLLTYMGIAGAYRFGYQVFNKEGMEPEPGKVVEITIEKGDSTIKVGKLLEKNGLIESKWVFFAQKVFYDARIYPGTYELNTAMSAQQILKAFSVVPVTQEPEEGTGGSQ